MSYECYGIWLDGSHTDTKVKGVSINGDIYFCSSIVQLHKQNEELLKEVAQLKHLLKCTEENLDELENKARDPNTVALLIDTFAIAKPNFNDLYRWYPEIKHLTIENQNLRDLVHELINGDGEEKPRYTTARLRKELQRKDVYYKGYIERIKSCIEDCDLKAALRYIKDVIDE